VRTLAALVAVVVLALATVYEAAQALGVISIGDVPGEGAPGEGLVGAGILFAYLTTLVVVLSSFANPERVPRTLRQLLPIAPVAAVVVGYYTFDPYYAPTERRYSDYRSDGATLWIALVLGAAIVASVLARRSPRLGTAATAIVLLLCIPTAFLGAGH
jgi:hypothetical protein